MPLLKRKRVDFLPVPPEIEQGLIPGDQEVWQIRQTGEIFLTNEAFTKRIAYYREPIFTCELTGKSNLNFFDALKSEDAESKKIQDTFPDVLKPRVIRACHYQVEGRLESLIDLVYDHFAHRFFLGESVIVNGLDPNAAKVTYYARIVRVTPPKQIRDLLRPENAAAFSMAHTQNALVDTTASMSTEPDDHGKIYTAEQLDKVSHIIGAVQLETLEKDIIPQDDPSLYTYSIQLMEGKEFTGSIVEVTEDKLERDRTTWNKALLKKFLKDCLARDPAVGSPWSAKVVWFEKYKEQYGFKEELPQHLKEKSDELRADLLQRRRKQPKEEDPDAPPKEPKPKRVKKDPSTTTDKRRKTKKEKEEKPPPRREYYFGGPSEQLLGFYEDGEAAADRRDAGLNPLGGAEASASTATIGPLAPRLPKPKYPIEDLNLDPTTIFDGRVRRAKHLPLPQLPTKPCPRDDLPVPQEHMDRTLMCWNTLNIFGHPLQISPFTLDDFVNALNHDTLDPRCVLLGEIHSVLTNNVAAENFSIPGAPKAAVDSIPLLAATVENKDGMSIAKREMWVNAALDYSRGWDRKARPKAADGRKGWERHLLGILTQKGGLENMPSLPTIFKHLFTDEDYVSEPEDEETEASSAAKQAAKEKPNGKSLDDDAEMDESKADQTDPSSSPRPEPKHDPKPIRDDSSEASDADDDEEKDRKAQNDEEEASKHVVSEEADELEDDDEVDEMEVDVSMAGTSNLPKRTKKPRFAGSDHPDPEARYLTLSLEHKLDILSFLCQINLHSKAIRAYIEDCELKLTEERKEKAEINKEKKELMAEKNALLKAKAALEAAAAPPVDNDKLKVPGDANGATSAPGSAAVTPQLSSMSRMDLADSSMAPSDVDDSVMPDEPPSRQPSSSPLPELDDSSSTHSMTAKIVKAEDDIEDPDETDLHSEVPDQTSEPGEDDLDQDQGEDEEMEGAEVDQEEENKFADAGDEQDELDVGSDVDELQSSPDPEAQQAKVESPEPDTSVVEKTTRGGKGKKGKAAGKKRAKSVDRLEEIEQALEMNAKKDDLFERDWRRYREVARVRPLGKDRYHQKYWWFDGIGPQSLIAPNGRVIYGTGRLFVQGHSQPDYDMLSGELGGPGEIVYQMERNEGVGPPLNVDEWAYYQSAEDVENLLLYLNNKGIREKELKERLTRWKHYIIEGFKSRQDDLLHGFEATAPAAHQRSTRSARGSKEYHENPSKHYLAYENSLAQK